MLSEGNSALSENHSALGIFENKTILFHFLGKVVHVYKNNMRSRRVSLEPGKHILERLD